MKETYNICVVGAGYVGLSNAILLSQRHHVDLFDLNEERIRLLQHKESPLHDQEIIDFLTNKKLMLNPMSSWESISPNIDLFVIATPTDYNPETNYFDTSSIEITLKQISKLFPGTHVIIKSTIPIGFTEGASERFPMIKISFSPEFLREGRALQDNLYPSRIVMGSQHADIQQFAELWKSFSLKFDVPVIITKPTEAESIKLFANSYLAMRVAYFNELDSFAEVNQLNTKDIVDGVSADPRIGDHYNNPSFGYGGYCFPKDTKQLRSSFGAVPESLVSAIVESNETRKKFVLDQIMKQRPKVVGIYRLVMKSGSDNFRESAIISIMNGLIQRRVKVIVYEPMLEANSLDYELTRDFAAFVQASDFIIANRLDEQIKPYQSKVYTRDLFQRD
jgi:UDPglucose 6-dehydrogenase